ncbi:lipase family protein, partial [Rhodoplanes roseus]
AVLAAQRAAERGLTPEVYTFGMPRTGNEEFARDYDVALGPRTYRLVHGEDIVPTVPPSGLGFRHVGHCLACARHTRFDAARLTPPPCDDPPFGPGLQSALLEGARLMLSLSLDPQIRSDLIGQASRLLPPALGDHLPDRYWQALAAGGPSAS